MKWMKNCWHGILWSLMSFFGQSCQIGNEIILSLAQVCTVSHPFVITFSSLTSNRISKYNNIYKSIFSFSFLAHLLFILVSSLFKYIIKTFLCILSTLVNIMNMSSVCSKESHIHSMWTRVLHDFNNWYFLTWLN